MANENEGAIEVRCVRHTGGAETFTVTRAEALALRTFDIATFVVAAKAGRPRGVFIAYAGVSPDDVREFLALWRGDAP